MGSHTLKIFIPSDTRQFVNRLFAKLDALHAVAPAPYVLPVSVLSRQQPIDYQQIPPVPAMQYNPEEWNLQPQPTPPLFARPPQHLLYQTPPQSIEPIPTSSYAGVTSPSDDAYRYRQRDRYQSRATRSPRHEHWRNSEHENEVRSRDTHKKDFRLEASQETTSELPLKRVRSASPSSTSRPSSAQVQPQEGLNRMILVFNIPTILHRIDIINNHFRKFGQIVNLQVC